MISVWCRVVQCGAAVWWAGVLIITYHQLHHPTLLLLSGDTTLPHWDWGEGIQYSVLRVECSEEARKFPVWLLQVRAGQASKEWLGLTEPGCVIIMTNINSLDWTSLLSLSHSPQSPGVATGWDHWRSGDAAALQSAWLQQPVEELLTTEHWSAPRHRSQLTGYAGLSAVQLMLHWLTVFTPLLSPLHICHSATQYWSQQSTAQRFKYYRTSYDNNHPLSSVLISLLPNHLPPIQV